MYVYIYFNYILHNIINYAKYYGRAYIQISQIYSYTEFKCLCMGTNISHEILKKVTLFRRRFSFVSGTQ